MSYVDAQGTLHKDVLNIPVNAGKKPGITLQYATFYNGKIYAVSKQAKTSSSERLIRINPATWEIEKMGGAGFDGMDKELRTFHFLGVSDKEGYLSGSDARIYKVKLDDLSAEMVEGPGWDDLRDREVGNMILCRGKIVVEVYGHHEGITTDVFQHELWVLNVEDGSVRTKFPYKGLFNPVVTKDGRLLAVRVLGRSVKEKRYFLVELDADNVSAEPKVLLEFAQNMRPADFQTQVWSWSQGYLYASTRENVLYFNTDRSMFQMKSIAKIDLNELKPTEVYKSEILLYGISRENPHDGSIWVNLNGSWSPEDKLVRIVRENGVYKESDRYSFKVPYGFASCPFFEDRHRAEVAKPGRVCKVGVDSEVDLCDLVEDKDGFSASVLFSDLKVGGNSGWKFELVDHHLLRVVKASRTESAQVTLKAFSSGLYSDLTFDFTFYQQLTTHATVGGKVKVERENDGKILEDAAELHKGDVLKISVVPDTEGDYLMKSLRVNGEPWSNGDTYKVEDQSVTVDAEFALRPYSLVVTHTGEGEVKVVRRREELKSGAKVYKGEVLEIEPRPESDYKLKSLKINGEEISGQYKCTVGTGDVEVEAEFVEKPYVLTMKQSGEGKLKVERNGKTLSGGEKVDEGDKLKITAEPATSYKLKSITVNGALIKSGAVYTVQKGNVEVLGEFEEKPYTLTMEHSGKGRIAALWKARIKLENGAKVDKDDYLTITLVPEAGNKIGSFKINGQVQSGVQKTYRVQGEDVHVEAKFIEQPCTLTMKQKGEGTLSVICQKKSLQNGAKIGRGDWLEIKAEPKVGCKLSSLTMNGTSIKSGYQLFMREDEDVEVVAEFVKKSYMLTMKSTGQGELKVSAKGKFLETGTGVDKGEVLIISAEPKLNYELSSLTVNGIDQESGGKFVVGEKDVVVKAEFVEKRYVLTTSHTGDGKVIVKERGRVLESGARISQDEVLSIYVEPGIGWKLSSLNVNGISKKNGAKTVVSDGDVEVRAEFVQVGYTLSVSCFGDGTLTVTRGGDKLKSGAAVRKGEELKLTAAEGPEYTLKSLMVNGEKRKNGELFTVGSEDVIIVVEFVRQVVPVLYTLSYTDPAEGKITVQRKGETLESGNKTLEAGQELVITAAPKDATKHELESLKVNGAPFESGATFTVGAEDVKVEATFKEKAVTPVLYTLTTSQTGEGMLKVLRGNEELMNGEKLQKGDKLVIEAKPNSSDYKLVTLNVNGTPFASGSTYTVGDQNVRVEVVFDKSTAVESVLLAGVAATPNPCGARLTLRGASTAVQWEVYTVQGQLVARGVSAGEGEIEIATAGWIPGVYYVRLEATDGVRVLPVVKE